MTQVRNVFLNGQGNADEFMQDFYSLNRQKTLTGNKEK